MAERYIVVTEFHGVVNAYGPHSTRDRALASYSTLVDEFRPAPEATITIYQAIDADSLRTSPHPAP